MKKRYVIPKIIYENRNPNNDDDVSLGYVVGQPWINLSSKEYFLCSSNNSGIAIWKKVNLDNTNNQIRFGKSNFLGYNFPREIYHGLDREPTFISIFPIEQIDSMYPLGDIWATKDNEKIYIYNTGESKISFCWFCSYEQFEYEELEVEFNHYHYGFVYTIPCSGIIETNTVISFPKNSLVKVCAIPYDGQIFNNWNGYDRLIQNPDIIEMDITEFKKIEANFAVQNYTLRVTKIGAQYGGIISSPTGINCGTICQNNFPIGTNIELSYSIYDNDVLFDGWEGCDEVTDDGKCLIQLNNDRDIVAIFKPDLPKLTVLKQGSGLVKSLPMNIIDCGPNCIDYFQWDQIINLQAIPEIGYNFITWYGDISGTNPIESLTMDVDKVVGALFSPINFIVSINKIGNGRVLTSHSSSLDCGIICQNIFNYGTILTFTGNPDPNYNFEKWIINGVEYLNNPLDITITQTTNIDAIFKIIQYNVNVNVGENGQISSIEPNYNINSDIIIDAIPDINYELDEWVGCDEVINNKCYINNINDNKNISVSFKTIIPQSGTGTSYGYICGGNDTKRISKFIFPFDSGICLHTTNLVEKNKNSCANHSSTYAYICGGQFNNNIFNTIQRLTFSNDTIPITNNNTLSDYRAYSSANNSSNYGYVCSGNLNKKDIVKFSFPLDIGTTHNYGNLNYVYIGSGIQSSQYGYIIGSYIQNEILEPLINNEKFNFSLDSGNSISTMSTTNNYIYPASCNCSLYGYISSGCKYNNGEYLFINGFEQIDFSLDSGSSVEFSQLTKTNILMSSNNSSSYGFICGGYNSSLASTNTMNKINFSLLGENLESQNITMDENKHSMSATDGTIF